jgi:hypothetical protein
LYRLATLLRESGFEALVNDKPENDDYIAVYPETTKDINPFGARRWVRYCLHRPGVVGGPRSFPRGTVKFWYDPIFRGANLQDHLLTIPTIELDLFNLDGVGIRDTTSTWIGRAERKGYMPPGKPLGERIITHDWPPTRKEVADLLKRSNVFYCYEPFSSLNVEANLCGCPAIIMTDMSKYPIPRKEFDAAGWSPPGIGWGPNEIDRATQTLPSVLPGYLAAEENMKLQLTDFIEITQNI